MNKLLNKGTKLLRAKGEEGKTYTGLSPINVDNTKNEISINDDNYAKLDATQNIFSGVLKCYNENTHTDSTITDTKITVYHAGRGNLASIEDIGFKIFKFKDEPVLEINDDRFIYQGNDIPEQILNLENSQKDNTINFSTITENLTEQQKLILTNEIAIKVNEKDIQELVLENKRQINFLGIYDSTFNYMKNDSVVNKDKYYISLVDNNKQPLNDKNSWFSGAPTIDIDLSKYYTIIEINDMLKPLEQRLVVNESGVKVNTENIKNNDIYYENQFSDITGNIAIIDKKVEINMSNIVKKQNKLVAGKNIIIDETTNTISATGGSVETWESLIIQLTTTGFNIQGMDLYSKIKISSRSNLKIYTALESDYMGSWIAPNTLNLLETEWPITIPLTTNESSPLYIGGYIYLVAAGKAVFNVRYLNNGNIGNSAIIRWVGEIVVKGVKK